MKYFIFSDIHGSATTCASAIEQYQKTGCDMIILLGDILYHGARNPIPEGYDNPAVSSMLNSLSDRIITCRGNCDPDVSEMVLDFPVMQDRSLIVDGRTRILCTHGHVISPAKEDGTPLVSGSKLPPKSGWDILLYGHTHVPVLYRDAEGRIICNPGSITFPKGGSEKGYAIYDNGHIALYSLSGAVLKEL